MKSNKIIRSKNDILKFFQEASISKKELLTGLEIERSGIFDKNLNPCQYSGNSGYLAILKKLVEEVGWKVIDQDEKGNIKALKRGGSEIHIEYDGRIELVSKPRKRLFTLCREYQIHTNEIDQISKEFGVRWVSMGWQPFSKTNKIRYASKHDAISDYKHHKKQYPNSNKEMYEEWSKMGNGVHVNFGYTSEKDAIDKFQTLVKIAPILSGMFANSPFKNKKFSGFLAYHHQSTFQVCPEKTRIKKEFLQEDFSFEKWIDFLINLPMRRIERNGRQIFVPLTFKDFLKNNFQGYIPRIKDFYLHIKSVWNEIRIKHYLEYRGFDSVPPHLIPSTPTIIRALTLNQSVMQECQNLVKSWNFEDHLEMREKVYKHALQAKTPNGGKVLDLAKEVLNIASYSMNEYYVEKKSGIDASRFLRPIKEYVFVKEQSPAEYVMEMWNGKWHKDPRKLIEWSES